MSGSFSPLEAYIPYFPNLLGNESALYNSIQNAFGASLPTGILPFGTAGLSGVTVYTLYQKLIGSVRTAAYSQPKIDMSEMMRSLQGTMQAVANPQWMTRTIPEGMSKTQYMILNGYRRGHSNPKKVAKMLSMDKKSVEEQTRVLQSEGYLTKNRKLTSKGVESLS
ncbi:MAG TPA: hypothetical protein VE955_03335 [Candidatus Dormibacteraeota bacterium]|nr:hypothetical protein [Candidatus Dormibacteraeota bacterium]